MSESPLPTHTIVKCHPMPALHLGIDLGILVGDCHIRRVLLEVLLDGVLHQDALELVAVDLLALHQHPRGVVQHVDVGGDEIL